MGIRYKNFLDIKQLEGYNQVELEQISEDFDVSGEIIKDDLEKYIWFEKNGYNESSIIKLSEKYKNTLFAIKSVKIEDFSFNTTDILFGWYLNGKRISCYLDEFPPFHSDSYIQKFIKDSTMKHIHDFNTISQISDVKIVMSCKCGETREYNRT